MNLYSPSSERQGQQAGPAVGTAPDRALHLVQQTGHKWRAAGLAEQLSGGEDHLGESG